MLFHFRSFRLALPVLVLVCSLGTAQASDSKAQCIVPAKPGGGMDQTCKLVQHALPANEMEISYLPGGVGAVAWSSIISQRKAEQNTLVAYSGGSLLNLAEGKFGKSDASNVRWVAAIGTDYGMIAVRNDSPYKN
ncbi:MAG: tripartite tricarboxylate transporter substrate binding protein, partial [Undibacterium sp.]|nr:tripartite tricarboxylate transporter substrate binding protein [Undibacterium sp.]